MITRINPRNQLRIRGISAARAPRGLAALEYLVVAAAVLGAVTLLLTSPVHGTTRIDETARGLMGKVKDQMTRTNLGDGRTADVWLE